MSGLDIQRRAVNKRTQKYKRVDGGITEYPRYSLDLPTEFVEKHKLEDLFLVADQVWFGLPDEQSLMKVIVLLPQIKQLLSKKGFTKEDIKKILDLNPEIREFVMEQIENEQVIEPVA